MTRPVRIEFAMPGEPQQQGSERIVFHGELCPKCRTKPIARLTHDNPALRRWRLALGLLARSAMRSGAPWKYAVGVEFVFVLTRPQVLPKDRRGDPITFPDLDKLVRGALDAMTGVVWEDDKQVTQFGTTVKRYPADPQEEPGVIVRAWAIHPDDELIVQQGLFDATT